MLSVAADGSSRQYYRLIAPDGRTAIGAFGPDAEENRAFLAFTRAFRSIELPVPELYAENEAEGVWLIEDLGDTTLFRALQDARDQDESQPFPGPLLDIYRRVVETLPRFQFEGHEVVDYDLAHPRAAFDRQSILWDLNYFKYHFLKLSGIAFNEARLEDDFSALADDLTRADANVFMYRDFQSRNVMLRDGEPSFIDYQGGRRGAPHYDIASLLYDAKADIPEPTREALLQHYLDGVERYRPVDRTEFIERYRSFVLVRILQALGAYGYRGFFERKPRFLQSVPYAARNIDRLLATGLPVALPEIERTLRAIVDEWGASPEGEDGSALTVHVNSFSYRRGYPEDLAGHGGGFVFDCRALPNPGREARYADLTGRDPAVAAFFEDVPELGPFWDHAVALSESQIEAYLDRGFRSLTISFGCTGGQHRSVFLSERMADHLRRRFPEIRVRLLHRERPRWPHTADVGQPA